MYNMFFDKKAAQQLISSKYGWVDYGGHHHESIFTRFVLSDWLINKFGIDKRKVTYSALVRSDQLSRAEALIKLAQPPQSPEQISSDREYVLKKLDISADEYDALLKGPLKNHYDFASYLPVIRGATNIVARLVSVILPWKPTIFFEYEIKRKMAALASAR
jgi:hypothetical protein